MELGQHTQETAVGVDSFGVVAWLALVVAWCSVRHVRRAVMRPPLKQQGSS